MPALVRRLIPSRFLIDDKLDTSRASYVWLPIRFEGEMGVIDCQVIGLNLKPFAAGGPAGSKHAPPQLFPIQPNHIGTQRSQFQLC